MVSMYTYMCCWQPCLRLHDDTITCNVFSFCLCILFSICVFGWLCTLVMVSYDVHVLLQPCLRLRDDTSHNHLFVFSSCIYIFICVFVLGCTCVMVSIVHCTCVATALSAVAWWYIPQSPLSSCGQRCLYHHLSSHTPHCQPLILPICADSFRWKIYLQPSSKPL